MLSTNKFIIALLLSALTFASHAQRVAAPAVQTSPAGVRYVVGGVGDDERRAMRSAYPGFKLQVVVAEKGGAYSADMQLRILGSEGRELLDVVIPGPWLLVDLPAGEYRLEATMDGNPHSQTIKLGSEVRQQVVYMWPKPVN